MPTYEYRCPDGHAFERFYRKISDAASELPCPECGKPAVRQLSGGAGLLFKGSGFYLTDYGKNAHRKPGPEGTAGKGTSGRDASGRDASGESSGGGEPKSSAGSTESKSSEAKSPSSTEPKATGPAAGSGGSSGKKSSGGGTSSSSKSDK